MFQMNLSNADLIEKSISKINLTNSSSDSSEEDEFAWIDRVPDTLQYALNISQIYTKNIPQDPNVLIKLEIWLETGGVALSPRITRIFLQKECEDPSQLTVWQLDPFDELISMQVSINSLRDRDIAIGCKISGIDGEIKGTGRIKVFGKLGLLKSGLVTLIMNDDSGNDDIQMLEDRLYRRKSKQVPTWHVQLMKERLKIVKEAFCIANSEVYVINFIIPIPSHPLKLRDNQFTSTPDELCSWDVFESQEDSSLKRRFPKLFSPTSAISNGDLRAIHGILQRGFDNSAVDSSNLLWTRREYLSKHFPSALIPFVQSVQWWLSASDPTEIDEALRMIEGWQLPVDVGEREEICAMLLVKMSTITGLTDSPCWVKLFERLLPEDFIKKYQSPLISFLTSASSAEMPELRGFLMKAALFSRDVGVASDLYWRLKVDSSDYTLFREYSEALSEVVLNEIGKQERLFEGIERVLMTAQKLKGPRAAKLELLKKLLGDPEASDIPSAMQSNPLLPGLQTSSGRIEAVVPDRCNLFKSTAFTVLLVFLRQEKTLNDLSLPIIFKRGDDLTRDAACLRIFRAIWDIWQRDGGLELFPRRLLYGVVPLGREFGMVEFVESIPLSKVIEPDVSAVGSTVGSTVNTANNTNSSADEWAVSRYLKELPDPFAAKSNFLASCVGFSLLTYLLGIGDRHLDNLLLTPQGHLLHIDFSFLFGADPKPFPPPIKMTREMVRGFEEVNEEKWTEFKGLCFTALTLLRRKSALIICLLESEYPARDCDFVKDRLAAMVSQAEALQKMDRLLEESRRAMFPLVMETIHKWVQYWKS